MSDYKYYWLYERLVAQWHNAYNSIFLPNTFPNKMFTFKCSDLSIREDIDINKWGFGPSS